MSHGHDDHHEEDYDHGHDDHGHEEDRLESQGNGHYDDHEEEEEEPFLEAAGIVNDLTSTHGEDPTIDLGKFFPVSAVLAVRHNDAWKFDDLKK